jgi:hypothetical protein
VNRPRGGGQDYRTMPFLDRFNQLEKIARNIAWMEVIELEVTTEGKPRRAGRDPGIEWRGIRVQAA